MSPWTHELLNVLKQNMRVEGKVFKILFTNSSRGHSLLKEIPIQNVVIIDGVKETAGSGVPAGRAFVKFDLAM